MSPEVIQNLAKNTSVCKDCNHSRNQWRAYHLFSLWWCASLLLVSEAQTLGWNVSLCVQVESALCANAFLCITRPAKKQWKRHEWDILWRIASHSVFLFSFYFSWRCFVSVKRLYFSTPFQCADTPTVRCWNWQKTSSVHRVVVPVMNMKGVILCMLSVFTDNIAMLLLITDFTLGEE